MQISSVWFKKILQSFSKVLLCFSVCILLTQGVQAQSFFDQLNIPVRLPDGITPAPNVEVGLLRVGELEYDAFAISDGAGIATFYGPLADANYIVHAFVSQSYDLPNSGLFRDTEYTKFFSMTDPEYNPGSFTYFAKPLKLDPAFRFFELQLTSGGSPLLEAGILVNAFLPEDYLNTTFNTLTNSSGIAYIPIPNTAGGEWSFSVTGSSYGDLSFPRQASPGPQNIQFSKELEVSSSTLTLKLKGEDGISSFSVPSGFTEPPVLTCTRQIGFGKETVYLNPGDTQATMSIPAGNYDCTGTIEGYFLETVVVNVPTGTSVAADLIVTVPNSSIAVSLVSSSSGTPYTYSGGTGYPDSIFCQDIYSGVFASKSLIPGDTGATFQLPEGTYECVLDLEGYLLASESISLLNGMNTGVTISVIEGESTIDVKLIDGQTSSPFSVPINFDMVDVSCESLTNFIFKEKEISQGNSSVQLSVAAGTHRCTLFIGGYFVAEQEVTVGVGETGLVQFSLSPPSSSVTISLYQSDGTTPYVLPDDAFSFADVFCDSLDGLFSRGKPLQSGESALTFQLPAGLYSCNAIVNGLFLQGGQVSVQDKENATLNITVIEASSEVSVQLVAGGSSDPFFFPSDPNVFGDVFCASSDGLIYVGAPLESGLSGATVSLPAGTFLCGAHIEGYGSDVKQVTIGESESKEVSVRIYDKNSQVKIRLLDETTKAPIQGLEVEYFIQTIGASQQTAGIGDFGFDSSSLGEVLFDVIAGVEYEVGLELGSVGAKEESINVVTSADGTQYVLPRNAKRFVSTVGQVTTVDIFPKKSSSSISVTVQNADGTLLPRGYLDAFSPSSFDGEGSGTAAEEDFFSTGTEIIDGKATLALVANREFHISVFRPFEPNGAALPPQIQRVTLKEGETQELTFSFVQPNYALSVSGRFENATPASIKFFGCSALNEAKQEVYFDIENGETTGTLSILVNNPPRKWALYCYAVGGSGGTEKYYYGEASFRPKKKTATGSIEVSLQEFSDYFDEEEYRFDVTQAQSLALPDNKGVVEIPAKALATSGYGRMIVKSGTGYTFSDTDYPLTAYDITFEVDGKEVTETLKPVKIHFEISKAKLAELGVSIEDMKGGSFDTSVRTWKEDATYSYDSENEVLTITVSHFSLWGVLIDKSNSKKREAPTKLRAKQLGKGASRKRYRISWDGPESNVDETFELDILKISKKKKRKKKKSKKRVKAQAETDWSKASTVEVVGTKYRTRFKAGKRYKIRVRVKDGVNSDEKGVRVK